MTMTTTTGTLPRGVATYTTEDGDLRFTFTEPCPSWCPSDHADIMIEDLAHWGAVCGDLALQDDHNDGAGDLSDLQLILDRRPEARPQVWLLVNDDLEVRMTLTEASRLIAMLTDTIEAATTSQ